jgi:hypothetical protein
MTAIPPGRLHRVSILVRGPKKVEAVKKYMAAIRKAVGRAARISQTPKPKAKRKRKRNCGILPRGGPWSRPPRPGVRR